MFDKEIVCYKVIISDYVSAMGKYRYLKTEKYYTEEEAVKAARKYISSTDIKYKAKIEQVCNVVGWWN